MEEENHKTKVITGEINADNLDWLQRSIIGGTGHAVDVGRLADQILKE